MHFSKTMIKSFMISGLAATLFFTSCDNKKGTTTTTPATTSNNTSEKVSTANSGKIAYVDMDTLEAKYAFFKDKKSEFEKKSAAVDAELGRLAQNLQTEYVAFQKKAQAGTLSQADGEAGQKKLQQMQQDIESRKQTLGAQMMKDQEAFNKVLQEKLDNYLAKYNKEKGYDYILSYAKGGSILFANKALDITEDVIKGMNDEDNIRK